MTINIALKTTSLSNFREGSGKKIIARLYASEIASYLLGWQIPLSPNVRRPRKTAIVQGIVESIEQNEEYEIPSPIHISSRSANTKGELLHLILSEPGENAFELGDGVIDGGHRLLALRLCVINGIKLDGVMITFCIHVGYPESEIKKLALALNTSQKVDNRSLANYEGIFDWLKPHLEGYKICYYSGQPDVPEDPWCSADRVINLLMLLNINYDPTSLTKNKHPFYLGNTGRVSKRDRGLTGSVKSCINLLDDVLWLQTIIAIRVNKLSAHHKIPFTQFPGDVRKCTHLPTGEVLSCKISPRVYSHPMISGFRALLSKDYHWLIDIRKEGETIINSMIRRYIDILKLQRYQHRDSDSIATDGSIWEEMYKIAYVTLPEHLQVAQNSRVR